MAAGPTTAEERRREPSRRADALGWLERHFVLVACAVCALAVVATFADFGVSWDEGVQARYGELTLAYWQTGGDDDRSLAFQDLRYYGPVLETALASLYAPWPALRFEIRHLALALLAIGLIPALVALTRHLGRPGASMAAVLALCVSPRLVGHAAANSKDVPFALAIALFMASLVPVLLTRRERIASGLVAGLAAGFALALRPGGLPLLLALFVSAAVLAHAVAPFANRRALGTLALQSAGLFVLAWVAMVAFWPWAHAAPVAHPLEAMFQAARFERIYPVLFAGHSLSSDALPRTYLPHYLAIATPLPILLLATVGLVFEGRRCLRAGAPESRFAFGLVCLWLFVPLAAAGVVWANLYDGFRHFLFVVPALCALAGLGAWHAAKLSSAKGWPRAGATAVALVIALPAIAVVQLHPYQTSYFNGSVGGLAGAAGRYEVDYWATSLSEAARLAAEHAERTRDRRAGRAPRVLVGATSPYPKWAVSHGLGEWFELETLAELARRPGGSPAIDYYIAPVRYGMDVYFGDAPILFEVVRDGVTLAVVRDMQGAPVQAVPVEAEAQSSDSVIASSGQLSAADRAF